MTRLKINLSEQIGRQLKDEPPLKNDEWTFGQRRILITLEVGWAGVQILLGRDSLDGVQVWELIGHRRQTSDGIRRSEVLQKDADDSHSRPRPRRVEPRSNTDPSVILKARGCASSNNLIFITGGSFLQKLLIIKRLPFGPLLPVWMHSPKSIFCSRWI